MNRAVHGAGRAQPVGRQRRRRQRPGDHLRRDDGRQQRRRAVLDRATTTATRCTSATSSRRAPASRCSCATRTASRPAHYVRDGATCANIQAAPVNGADTGRCVAGDISASSPGAEMWSSSVDRPVLGEHQRERRHQAGVDELPHLVGRRRDARAGRRHVDQQVRRQLDPERQRLRVEQRHQVDADADRRSARRLARGDHLAGVEQLGAAPLHDDGRHDAPHLHADARPDVPRRDLVAEHRVQPAAAPQLPHRQRHGGAARAQHLGEVSRRRAAAAFACVLLLGATAGARARSVRDHGRRARQRRPADRSHDDVAADRGADLLRGRGGAQDHRGARAGRVVARAGGLRAPVLSRQQRRRAAAGDRHARRRHARKRPGHARRLPAAERHAARVRGGVPAAPGGARDGGRRADRDGGAQLPGAEGAAPRRRRVRDSDHRRRRDAGDAARRPASAATRCWASSTS